MTKSFQEFPSKESDQAQIPDSFYLIGIDCIEDKNNQIKVLEIQNLFESNVSRAVEITGKNPYFRLRDAVTARYPDLIINEEPASSSLEKLKEHVQSGNKMPFPNRGIESLSLRKWLFYGVCNHYPELRQFIPETTLTTLGSLNTQSFNATQLPSKKYLFKNGAFSKGDGIVQIPSTIQSQSELKSFIEQQELNAFTHVEGKQYSPFAIQEYLYTTSNGKAVSKPAIRIYAAVAWKKETNTLSIWIDIKSAYQHVRIKQNPNDFTLQNNTHETVKIKHLEGNLHKFVKTFFTQCIAQQKQVYMSLWEIKATEYIKNAHQLTLNKRLNLLILSVIAIAAEVRYEPRRLARHQCKLLHALAETIQKHDLDTCTGNDFSYFFTAALHDISQNIATQHPIIYDPALPMLKLFKAMVDAIDISKIHSDNIVFYAINRFNENIITIQSSALVNEKPIPTNRYGFFDYLSYEDKIAVSNTSKDLLLNAHRASI